MDKKGLRFAICRIIDLNMIRDITPDQVEEAALKARVPLTTFIKRAGVSPSAFYRWRNGGQSIRALTKAKLADAMASA